MEGSCTVGTRPPWFGESLSHSQRPGRSTRGQRQEGEHWAGRGLVTLRLWHFSSLPPAAISKLGIERLWVPMPGPRPSLGECDVSPAGSWGDADTMRSPCPLIQRGWHIPRGSWSRPHTHSS